MVYRSLKTRKEGAPRPGTGYRLSEVSNHLGKWDEVLNTPEKALYLQDEKGDTYEFKMDLIYQYIGKLQDYEY